MGHWSFRGRFGLGSARHYSKTASYLRHDTKEDKLEMMSVVAVKKTDDKYTKYSRPVIHAFAYQTSVQAVFTPRKHFFFSAEIAFTGNIGHFYERVQTKPVVSSEAPSGWFSDYKQAARNDKALHSFDEIYHIGNNKFSAPEHHRVNPGNFLSFNLGFGWHIR